MRFPAAPHTSTISWIEPIYRDDMNGWEIWTASHDHSIAVLFVHSVRNYESRSSFYSNTIQSYADADVKNAIGSLRKRPPPRPQSALPHEFNFPEIDRIIEQNASNPDFLTVDFFAEGVEAFSALDDSEIDVKAFHIYHV